MATKWKQPKAKGNVKWSKPKGGTVKDIQAKVGYTPSKSYQTPSQAKVGAGKKTHMAGSPTVISGGGGYGSGRRVSVGGSGSSGQSLWPFYGGMLGAEQGAMEETQRRAQADREKSLSTISGLKDTLYGDAWQKYESGQSELEEMPSYNKAAIYGAGRDVLEAQNEDRKRRIQEGYYGALGAPSGAMRGELNISDIGKAGQLSHLKTETDTQAALKKRQDKLEEVGLAQQYAKDLFGAESDIAKSLADIYQNTINAVPDYASVTYPGQAGYGQSGDRSHVSAGNPFRPTAIKRNIQPSAPAPAPAPYTGPKPGEPGFVPPPQRLGRF